MRASKEKCRLCRPPRQWCHFSLCPFADFRYCVARAEKIGEPPIIPKFFGVSFQWLVEPPVARKKKKYRIYADFCNPYKPHFWHLMTPFLLVARQATQMARWATNFTHLSHIFPHCTDLRNRGICRPESECCILMWHLAPNMRQIRL